jgi:hypothetical protein
MKKKLSGQVLRVLVAVCISIIFLNANAAQALGFSSGINFKTALPQGEFSRNIENTGFGISGHFGMFLPNTPIMLGTEFSYIIYGHESRKEPFSPNIPDVTVDVETSNNIVTGHLLLRFQPRMGIYRPYFDGLFGFNYLFTQTTVKDEDDVGDDIASSTNYDDATLSYGVGGGIQIRVYNRPIGEDKPFAVFIDAGVRYLKGGEGEYLDEGAIKINDEKVALRVIKSKTDLLSIQIGVIITF